MIVPFAPGNATDSIAHTLKQPVVIGNRPGASGGIGMAALAKAAPDGYTTGVSAIAVRGARRCRSGKEYKVHKDDK